MKTAPSAFQRQAAENGTDSEVRVESSELILWTRESTMANKVPKARKAARKEKKLSHKVLGSVNTLKAPPAGPVPLPYPN